jgi:hypothetical protein
MTMRTIPRPLHDACCADWALALPCHALVSMGAGLIIYWCWSMRALPRLESLATIIDEYSCRPTEHDLGSTPPC